jgi:hypothetical protein
MKIRAFTFSLGLLLAISTTTSVYAEQVAVGKIGFAKGSNAAQQPNSAPRLLGKDAEVYQGDNIQTSDASFVIVEFNDGSKVTIRPNSNFTIEQFDSVNKNAKLTVHEGGVRASTGEFSKAGLDNFQIKTPSATLKGDKDSDFSVRVCKEDCEDKKEDATKDTSVAKVVDIKGNVFAQNRVDKNAVERKLTMGAGLNARDFLTSQADSYVVMVFRDGEKVTLQPNSEFDIVKYDFQKPGKKDQMLFKLATGGMRALTGSIGKKDHSAYALDTPAATIGIRGTESETVIDDAFDVNTGAAPVYNHVTEGAISIKNEAGEMTLNQGESSVTVSSTAPTVQVPSLPAKMTTQLGTTPSPKTAPNPDKAFDKPSTVPSSKSGTYATVNKGSAKMELVKGDDKGKGSSEKMVDKNPPDKGSSFSMNDKEEMRREKNNDRPPVPAIASNFENDDRENDGDNNRQRRGEKSPIPNGTNNEPGGGSGGGRFTNSSNAMMLFEGESSFSSESGGDAMKLEERPMMMQRDQNMPAPMSMDGNLAPPSTQLFSPMNEPNGGSKGRGGGCIVQ